MLWLKDNLVGLLMAVLVMGSSYLNLYMKSEANEQAISVQDVHLGEVTGKVSVMDLNLQILSTRATQLEGQMSAFTQSNLRLVTALDKLDTIYGTLKVAGAVRDERITQLSHKIDKVENRQ